MSTNIVIVDNGNKWCTAYLWYLADVYQYSYRRQRQQKEYSILIVLSRYPPIHLLQTTAMFVVLLCQLNKKPKRKQNNNQAERKGRSSYRLVPNREARMEKAHKDTQSTGHLREGFHETPSLDKKISKAFAITILFIRSSASFNCLNKRLKDSCHHQVQTCTQQTAAQLLMTW